MSGQSNFLSRWSRLKRESEARPTGSEVAAEPPHIAELLDAEASAIPELPAEELAALPRLEDLTPETDLAPFMRLGVPASLRNAALRRMWALDPTIRDRVGDALDYAYDWNLPGSVPGSGALLASDDVQAMLRAIVGGPEPERSDAAPAKPGEVAVEQAPEAAPEAEVSVGPQAERATALSHGSPANVQESVTGSAKAAPKEVAQVRRHGGATPF
ncbi:MAG: hypothetical protein QOG66_1567 [Methylobacteriaceae bacterium]|jgi:hypothetical protein|nr:hypothetical protein [Methylobacteriaceae bacterium]